uniref:Uncharacterized protein n=1 Tax=Ditylenchus dipsaci TaxID=166011 RepID=A0A915DDT1_9BILA
MAADGGEQDSGRSEVRMDQRINIDCREKTEEGISRSEMQLAEVCKRSQHQLLIARCLIDRSKKGVAGYGKQQSFRRIVSDLFATRTEEFYVKNSPAVLGKSPQQGVHDPSTCLATEDENGDELSFLLREPIEHERGQQQRKTYRLSNSYSYTHRNNNWCPFLRLSASKKNSVGLRKLCKGKGYMRDGQNFFFVTKLHNHDSKPFDYETKTNESGLAVAEVSLSARQTLPKDASISRQLQRKKYKVNMATVDTKKLKTCIPEVAQQTHDGKQFLRFDSRLYRTWTTVDLSLAIGIRTQSSQSAKTLKLLRQSNEFNVSEYPADPLRVSLIAVNSTVGKEARDGKILCK